MNDALICDTCSRRFGDHTLAEHDECEAIEHEQIAAAMWRMTVETWAREAEEEAQLASDPSSPYTRPDHVPDEG